MIIFQLANAHSRHGEDVFDHRVNNFQQATEHLRNNRGIRTPQLEDCTAQIQGQIATIRTFFGNDPRVERAISQYNPIGVRMPEADARRMLRLEGADQGLHLYGAALVGRNSVNILVLTDAGVGRPERIAETSTHELMHGIGEIIRKDQLTYNVNGRSRTVHTSRSFEEAMTNYVAASTTPNETQRPVTYPFHTATMIMVERVVGREAMREALLSERGDFTQVQNVLDQRLGSGTFQRMMEAFESNDPAGAFRAVSERVTGTEYMSVYSDPRMIRFVNTLTQLAQRRAQSAQD